MATTTSGPGGAGSGGGAACALDATWTVGLVLSEPEANGGYTLFAPIGDTTTYLIDACGRLVHSWPGTGKPGQVVRLLDDGRLLRTENTGGMLFKAGGAGGRIMLIEWDGAVSYSYEYATSEHRQHHDARMLPNGNLLFVAWELKTKAEAIALGRDPSKLGTELWIDALVELKPEGASGGKIVWEWRAAEHLVQAFDATKPGYAPIANHPELADLNFAAGAQADWTHV
ncbi:MAG: hypothetical protein EXR75_16530, partial [Myxococcales bacterium]|nr:hypothetical protein [Myxococcales bacterium]